MQASIYHMTLKSHLISDFHILKCQDFDIELEFRCFYGRQCITDPGNLHI